MKKASEYQQHAAECRQLASKMELGEHRDQLLAMAATWEALAEDRVEFVHRHPELAVNDDGGRPARAERAARPEQKRGRA